MHTKIKNIHKGIAEVNIACPTNLFIVDAIETLTEAQECRRDGCPAKLNTMTARTDPVSIDTLGQELLRKIDHSLKQNIEHIDYAQQYGIGTKNYLITKI